MKIPFDPLKLVPLVSGLFKLWSATIRFKPHGFAWEDIFAMNKDGAPLVISMWHGEIFPIAAFGYNKSVAFQIVVSQSKDGEFISQVLEKLGQKTVRGSSSRGGLKALLQACRSVEQDNTMVVMTIDGPRGPRHEAKEGILYLAKKAGARIVPVRAYPRKAIRFNSWDRFVLPLPFTRCDVHVGELFELSEGKLSKELLAKEKSRLEKRMLSLGKKE